MSELFEQLESNKKEIVEEAKQKILEQFINSRDSWLVNGLFDYYLSTNSANVIAILVNIREPHHNHLFERLSDCVGKGAKTDVKIQALTLLGHIVRNQPTWLYRLPEHHLLKDLLKLLKAEVDLLPLISALLVLIVLIPMVPYSMGEILNDTFEIFSRLASWNCNPKTLIDEQMIHLQVALYALFLRLYGMFPCNFLSYLRTEYKDKNKPVFLHTIKPMLETVKMNPNLVTTSKDNETASERWKKIAVHDVIAECERFSLDVSDTCCAHDSCQLASGFRSRSGTSNSTLEPTYFQVLKNLAVNMSNNDRNEFFSPSMGYNAQTPPVNPATLTTYVPQPEFTHDETFVPPAGSSPPETAIEATPETTPIVQEESNLEKSRQTSVVKSKFTSSSPSSSSSSPSPTYPQSPIHREKSPFIFPTTSSLTDDVKLQQKHQDKSSTTRSSTSPLKIHTGTDMVKHSPTKSCSSSVEPEEELLNIVRNEQSHQPILKQSDSVLHENDPCDQLDEDRSSPCTAGGLHMPNSKSMKDFAKRVQRLRHHSQCNSDLENRETMSSPEMIQDNTKVRRANSCPEMKKSPVSSIKDNLSRTLDETDEEEIERAESAMSNGITTTINDHHHHHYETIETQTDNFWPMPYEHLFLGIFPTLGNPDVKPNTNSGISSLGSSQEKAVVTNQPSVYEILDKYVETAVQDSERDSVKRLKNQLQLIHQQFLFEKHRREIHAFKNRRFLSEAKTTQVLEEHNSALRDQVQLQQNEIDKLKQELETIQKEKEDDNHYLSNKIKQLELHCKDMQKTNSVINETKTHLSNELQAYKAQCLALTIDKQKVEASLLDTVTEMKFAKERALAGEKGRAQLEYVNKQLLLIGELQLKYKERLDEVNALRRTDKELELLKESFSNEVKTLHQLLQEKTIKFDSLVAKIVELEKTIVKNDEIIASQKRTINNMTEETEEKLKALENKYQAQLQICRSMEEKMLELRCQIDMANLKQPIRSPDLSSCQEVQVSSDKANNSGNATAISGLSSPISLSMASSSEGSLAFLQTDKRELKSLQDMLDEETSFEMKTSEIPKDIEAPSTSSKLD